MNRWELSLTIAGQPASLDSVPLPVTITHGRTDPKAQPDAPVMTFDWAGPTPPGLLGDRVELWQRLSYPTYWTDHAATWTDPAALWLSTLPPSPRFVGTITTLTPVEELGQVRRWTCRAVGVVARLGAVPVLLDRPTEWDTSRVSAICVAAGFPLRIHGLPGLMLAPDAIDRDALSALHEVAAGAVGLIWQSRDGVLNYGTHSHRNTPPSQVIPADTILDGVHWNQDTGAIINHVTVMYGEPQQQTTHADDASMAQPWGQRHADVTTLATTPADADLIGLMVLARNAWPYWTMPAGMVLPMEAISAPDMTAVQDFDVSASVLVPIPTDPGPTPAPLEQWVIEGWTERWEETGHSMDLSLSEFGRYGSQGIRTWGDAAASTWAAEAAGSWLDALTLEGANT